MPKGIHMPAETSQPLQIRQFTHLEDYQAAVGGWIEAVGIPSLGATIFVNENGLAERLPFNARATFLWWYNVPAARQKAILVGDACIVGWPDAEGESTDLPSEVESLLMEASGYAVELRSTVDPNWKRMPTSYQDYTEAVVLALLILERGMSAEEVRIVPL